MSLGTSSGWGELDKGYAAFCLADRWFYDSPVVTRGDDVDFDIAERPTPEGWERLILDDWLVYLPPDVELPAQGWKIHVSACLDNADKVLATVWDYCVEHRVAFKFVRSLQLFLLRNVKYADRGSSGKLVTIYPADEGELESICGQLGALLEGQAGPYILSDLRWGDGPLYVRYGGFAERYCVGPNGEQQLAIADPDGTLVPDERGPVFRPPAWVTLPACLEPHRAARNQATVEDLPYRIEQALHFSNGGGVYRGVELRTGDQVVLKEARPHAGLALDGADAIARLRRERDVLERLAGLEVVPGIRDYFTVGDHEFLVEEFVEGSRFYDLLVDKYPLTPPETDETALAAYTSWALDICAKIEKAVAAIHDRGIVIGDFHPSNVLVRPDGRVVIIDLEIASDVSEASQQTIADPAFMVPPDRSGFDLDHYALACLRLSLFLPLTALLLVDPGKAEDLAADIGKIFPAVPPEFLAEAVAVISGNPGSSNGHRRSRPTLRPAPRWETTFAVDAEGWYRARSSMASAILSSATPQRDDRLFPGDVAQFSFGGLNLAYGAAGVLYALAVTGAGCHPEHENWLAKRALDPPPGTRLGLYDGLHGVAHVLERLGRRDDALAVLDICTRELAGNEELLGLDLQAGLAGVALNLAHFALATGDSSLRDAAGRTAELVADRLGEVDSVPTLSGGAHPHAGLLRGSSGPALMFIRLYEQTGDSALLDFAATAIRQDLRRCYRRDDGSLEVNEGWRTMPYLADGSVGIGMVLLDYLAHRADEELAESAAAIRRAAQAQFYIEPGLFHGRAGMILYLSRSHPPGRGMDDRVVAAHIRRLAWHAVPYEGHTAFPGQELLRLSMDLGTGTAGVLLAVGAALHDAPVHLPFLGPLVTHSRRRAALLASIPEGR